MANSFTRLRLCLFAAFIVAAGVVLGITASLNNRLSTTGLHDFLIFSLAASIFTIVILLILLQRSQPRIDAVVLFILAALWLTMGAYSSDIIGHQLCYSLKGQTIPAKNDTTMSAESYCRQMKTIQAFSWANFVIITLWLIRLINIVNDIHAKGNRDIWSDSISEVTLSPEDYVGKREKPEYMYPSSSEYMYPSNSGTSLPPPTRQRQRQQQQQQQQQQVYYPNSPSYRNSRGSLPSHVVQQQPGHSVVVQNGRVIQVPGNVVS